MFDHQYIYLIHVLFVGPLLMLAIFYIGLIVVLYHSHKLFKLNNII